MKKTIAVVTVLVVAIAAASVSAAPPLFKQKKYFGPIPFNTFSCAVGFMDGPTAENLTDYLSLWAEQRNGYDSWEYFTTSPYVSVGYARQMTPNHFFKASVSFGYLSTSSAGEYVATVYDVEGDSLRNVQLDIERDLKVYLFQLEAGFSYSFIEPEPRNFSPYVGAGLSAVIPLVRLDTESWEKDGTPFDNPGENVSRNSIEPGFHAELGLNYYISNRYSVGMEGRYQLSKSDFYHHDANFDVEYSGFTLTLDFNYHF